MSRGKSTKAQKVVSLVALAREFNYAKILIANYFD